MKRFLFDCGTRDTTASLGIFALRVMIGLVMTANGFPLAHHVFPGNTQDAATLSTILDDVQDRFGIGPITVVADRGLVSPANIAAM